MHIDFLIPSLLRIRKTIKETFLFNLARSTCSDGMIITRQLVYTERKCALLLFHSDMSIANVNNGGSYIV